MRWLALVLEDLWQASGFCSEEKATYTYADIKDLHVAGNAKRLSRKAQSNLQGILLVPKA